MPEAGPSQMGTYVPLSIIDAAGDLIVGTANDTAARLAKGSALDVLRVNAGATALEWAAAAAGLTAEQVMDTIATMLVAGAGITKTYNDAGDTLTLAGEATAWASYYNGYGLASDTVIASGFNNDRIIGGFLLVREPITVSALTIYVTTAGSAGSLAHMGIYKLAGGNLTTSNVATLMVDAGTVAVDTTGAKTISGLTTDLDPGLYVAVISHNSSTTLYVRRFNLSGISAVDVTTNTTTVEAYGKSPQAYGALATPLTFTPVVTTTGAGRATLCFVTATLR